MTVFFQQHLLLIQYIRVIWSISVEGVIGLKIVCKIIREEDQMWYFFYKSYVLNFFCYNWFEINAKIL